MSKEEKEPTIGERATRRSRWYARVALMK